MGNEEQARLQKALNAHQDLVWQSMGKYSEQLNWGLTGIQPECWVMLDLAVKELVAARKLIHKLKQTLDLQGNIHNDYIAMAVESLVENAKPKADKADKEATWISVDDELPPDGVWVETMIKQKSWDAWCLIRRYRSEGVWRDQDGKWANHPPTHWHR